MFEETKQFDSYRKKHLLSPFALIKKFLSYTLSSTMEFSGCVTNYTYFCPYRIMQRKEKAFLVSNFTPILRNICLLLFRLMRHFQANCT